MVSRPQSSSVRYSHFLSHSQVPFDLRNNHNVKGLIPCTSKTTRFAREYSLDFFYSVYMSRMLVVAFMASRMSVATATSMCACEPETLSDEFYEHYFEI